MFLNKDIKYADFDFKLFNEFNQIDFFLKHNKTSVIWKCDTKFKVSENEQNFKFGRDFATGKIVLINLVAVIFKTMIRRNHLMGTVTSFIDNRGHITADDGDWYESSESDPIA